MKLIGSRVDSVSYASANERIIEWACLHESRYVCVANVHMMMEAFGSLEFRMIIDNADLVTPDGMPLVWMLRIKGERNQPRVYGPTLMLHILESAARNGVSVGF